MAVSRALSRKLHKLKAAMGKAHDGGGTGSSSDDADPSDPDQFMSISFDECEAVVPEDGKDRDRDGVDDDLLLYDSSISEGALTNASSSAAGSVAYLASSSHTSSSSGGGASSGTAVNTPATSASASGANSMRTSPNATMVNLSALNPSVAATSIIREVPGKDFLPKLERTPSGNTLYSNHDTNLTTISSANVGGTGKSSTGTTKHLSQLSTSSSCVSVSELSKVSEHDQDVLEEAQADQMAMYILEKVRDDNNMVVSEPLATWTI